jgi:hypothetical protein
MVDVLNKTRSQIPQPKRIRWQTAGSGDSPSRLVRFLLGSWALRACTSTALTYAEHRNAEQVALSVKEIFLFFSYADSSFFTRAIVFRAALFWRHL